MQDNTEDSSVLSCIRSVPVEWRLEPAREQHLSPVHRKNVGL